MTDHNQDQELRDLLAEFWRDSQGTSMYPNKEGEKTINHALSAIRKLGYVKKSEVRIDEDKLKDLVERVIQSVDLNSYSGCLGFPARTFHYKNSIVEAIASKVETLLE